MTLPLQPVILDKNGVIRFKANTIIEYLYDRGYLDLNLIACLQFSQEDKEQFAQLLGYSLSGFLDLSFISKKTARKVAKIERNFINEHLQKSQLRQKRR